MKTLIATLAFAATAVPLASCNAAPAQPGGGKGGGPTQSTRLAIDDYGTFDEPWAIAFIPGSERLLVTERKGKLKLVGPDKSVRDVAGVPKVDYGGQGGLGDVLVVAGSGQGASPSAKIYLSWAEAGEGDTRGAAVGRGDLECNAAWDCRIANFTTIWRQSPKTTGRGHYSHRLTMSPDGKYLYVASGERQKMTPAQDLAGNLGKVLRLLPDGTPAPGNPFATRGGISSEIWSYGHRNILGLGWDARGRLWDLEHGPAGGDELNLVAAGKNYGWPLVSEGDHYDGKDIPPHSTRPDIVAPAISWNPVIAPGGFIFYSGDKFPSWKGEAIIAGMVYPGLVRVQLAGDKAREVARIDMGKRIRAIAQGPDGAIWIVEDKSGARLRKLTPKS